MKPLDWRTTLVGDRVVARKVQGGRFHPGQVAKLGRCRVPVQLDDGRKVTRHYGEVFTERSARETLAHGALTD